MNKEQKNKYAFELMVKNNPDEAVKQLIMLNKYKDKYKDLELKNSILEYNKDKALAYIHSYLIPYGDEWHWDNSSIRDYVEEVAKILDSSNNKEYVDWEGDSDGTSSNE